VEGLNTGGELVRRPSFGFVPSSFTARCDADYTAATGLNLLIDRKARASVSFKETLPEVFSQLPFEEQRRLDSAARGHSGEPGPDAEGLP
jgi:hypothetical protein